MLWKLIKRVFKLGEHIDFGGKLVEIVINWRTITAMAISPLVGIVAYVENRPWSEIIIVGLAALVLLLAILWGAALFFEWWEAPPSFTSVAEPDAPTELSGEIENFALALNVQKIWVQMPYLKDSLIHINVDIFNGNRETDDDCGHII